MADECDVAADAAQVVFDAALRNARAAVSSEPKWFEVCQFCGEATVDGLPYCDEMCHADHVRELAIKAKQFGDVR